jgi:hypothetical protein
MVSHFDEQAAELVGFSAGFHSQEAADQKR